MTSRACVGVNDFVTTVQNRMTVVGSNNIQNCVTSFMDDPAKLMTYLLIINLDKNSDILLSQTNYVP